MRSFETYSPEGVIAENLQELTERADLLCEQEIAHLRELAIEIAEGDDLSDLLSSLPDYRITPITPLSNVLTNNREQLSRSRKLLEAPQKILPELSLFIRSFFDNVQLPSFAKNNMKR